MRRTINCHIRHWFVTWVRDFETLTGIDYKVNVTNVTYLYRNIRSYIILYINMYGVYRDSGIDMSKTCDFGDFALKPLLVLHFVRHNPCDFGCINVTKQSLVTKTPIS